MSAAADIIIIEKEVEHMTPITLPHNHGESADEPVFSASCSTGISDIRRTIRITQ